MMWKPWHMKALEKFMEYCLLWKGPHTETGEEYEESSPRGRRGAEKMCDWLQLPFPSSCADGGEKVENQELREAREEGGGGGRKVMPNMFIQFLL